MRFSILRLYGVIFWYIIGTTPGGPLRFRRAHRSSSDCEDMEMPWHTRVRGRQSLCPTAGEIALTEALAQGSKSRAKQQTGAERASRATANDKNKKEVT
jgi:hypothetical protein